MKIPLNSIEQVQVGDIIIYVVGPKAQTIIQSLVIAVREREFLELYEDGELGIVAAGFLDNHFIVTKEYLERS